MWAVGLPRHVRCHAARSVAFGRRSHNEGLCLLLHAQDEDLSLSLPQLLATARGRLTVAAELLALVGLGCRD